ncbi:hypothetical protein HK096_001133, partial [Nowakowskiella sp. JEL0078]
MFEIAIGEVVFDENHDAAVIGRGTFSVVKKAKWMGHEVAVKLFLTSNDGNLKEKSASRFSNPFVYEYELTKNLRHPNIIQIFGACLNSPSPFFIMELMSCSLKEKLSENSLKTADVLRFISEISLGMNFLHSRRKQVLHGDLKAANILLDKHNTIKISDFGFARLKQSSTILELSHSQGSSSLLLASHQTKGGGTFFWMAPERLTGGDLTPAVDIYAFGMTCWEILSGGLTPFESTIFDIPSLIAQVVYQAGRPPKPDAAKKFTPESLMERDSLEAVWALTIACWRQDPVQRPEFTNILSLADFLSSGKDPWKDEKLSRVFLDPNQAPIPLPTTSQLTEWQQQATTNHNTLQKHNADAAAAWDFWFTRTTWEVEFSWFFAAIELELLGFRTTPGNVLKRPCGIDFSALRNHLDPLGKCEGITLGLWRILMMRAENVITGFERFRKESDVGLELYRRGDTRQSLRLLAVENSEAHAFWTGSFVKEDEPTWDEFFLALQQELGVAVLDCTGVKALLDPWGEMPDGVWFSRFRVICRGRKVSEIFSIFGGEKSYGLGFAEAITE